MKSVFQHRVHMCRETNGSTCDPRRVGPIGHVKRPPYSIPSHRTRPNANQTLANSPTELEPSPTELEPFERSFALNTKHTSQSQGRSGRTA